MEWLSTTGDVLNAEDDRMKPADLSPIEKARRQYVDMILRVEFIRADELLKRQKED